MITGRYGSRTPTPTATRGSLLELIQLAQQRCAAGASSHGASGSHRHPREYCLRAAETHASLLDATMARDGLRSFVEHCDMPWDGLWRQIAPVVGAEIEIRTNTELSLNKKAQRARSLTAHLR